MASIPDPVMNGLTAARTALEARSAGVVPGEQIQGEHRSERRCAAETRYAPDKIAPRERNAFPSPADGRFRAFTDNLVRGHGDGLEPRRAEAVHRGGGGGCRQPREHRGDARHVLPLRPVRKEKGFCEDTSRPGRGSAPTPRVKLTA